MANLQSNDMKSCAPIKYFITRAVIPIAIAAAVLSSTGREAVTGVSKGIQNTVLDIKSQYNHGEAGVLPYREGEIMLGNSQTSKTLARHFGTSEYVPGIQDTLAKYIAAANNLPDTNTEMKSDQIVVIPVYDPVNGRRLGDLIDDALKKSSQ